MLRNPPKFNYCGLTIIMSNASRFDKTKLLSAVAGHWFDNECLRPDINQYQCDVRLADDRSSLLPNTKCVLLLGQKALSTKTNSPLTLGEVRGTPLYTKEGISAIASFLPQDAMDIKDFESYLNPESQNTLDIDDSFQEEKTRGKTSRSNYRFWLYKDTQKIKQVLANNGKFPEDELEAEYIIYPNSEEVIKLLENTKNQEIVIDIESDTNFNILCLGFCIYENNQNK